MRGESGGDVAHVVPSSDEAPSGSRRRPTTVIHREQSGTGATELGLTAESATEAAVQRRAESAPRPPAERLNLRVGEWVEVRCAAEILGSLDADYALDGLPFMPEMLQY